VKALRRLSELNEHPGLAPGQYLLEAVCAAGQVANWTPVTNTPVLVNGQNAVILEPAAAQKSYRLQRVQ
jgi:hypothetical protein